MNYRDDVTEITASIGTGVVILSGAVTGFISFAAAGVSDNEDIDYAIRRTDLTEWETGSGTYHSAGSGSITRNTVTRSSNGGALVNFSAGIKNVSLTLSERFMNKISLMNPGTFLANITGIVTEPQQIPISDLVSRAGVPAGLFLLEEGPEGPIGPPGLTGGTGAAGPQGPQGIQGISGEVGDEGPQGDIGPPGLTGPQGATGQTGPQGALGPPGLTGEDGQDGEIGFPGPTGPQGPQGTPGTGGTTGPIGPPGIDGYDGEDWTPGPQGLNGADALKSLNHIINGGMDFAQRQAPATLNTYSQTAARGYTADRWAITNENASIQYIRTLNTFESGLLALYYGTWSKITSTGKFFVSQVLESFNCFQLAGKEVRVQLKLKASAAKTLRIILLQWTGTRDVVAGYASGAPSGTFISAFGANTTDPTFGTSLAKIAPVTTDNTSIRNTGLDAAVTTAWQRFGGTFVLPTASFLNLVLVVGTDSQFAAADSFSMSEAGLYPSTEFRDWIPLTYTQNLLNCQRYFCKSFSPDTGPVQNAGLANAIRGNVSVAGAVAAADAFCRFPVSMFSIPVLTFFNPSAANAFMRNVTAASSATTTTGPNAHTDGTDIQATGAAGWTVAQSTAVHYTADSEI